VAEQVQLVIFPYTVTGDKFPQETHSSPLSPLFLHLEHPGNKSSEQLLHEITPRGSETSCSQGLHLVQVLSALKLSPDSQVVQTGPEFD